MGCGFVGRGAHVPAIANCDAARLVAVADSDPRRREKAAARYNVPASYDDYRKLAEDPRVDAVIVSLPTPLHVPASLSALEAGKHVLCEMPLAATLDQADRLIEVARRAGLVLMPGLTFRFTSNYVQTKDMIARQAVGHPTCISYRELIPADDLAGQWPAGSWMWDVNQSGGPLFTLSVWSIDLVRWLFDTEIVSIEPVARYTPLATAGGTSGYDAFVALRLANGLVGGLQYSGSVNRAAAQSSLEIIGDSGGMLRATNNTTVTLFGQSPCQTTWNCQEDGARTWGHQQQDEYFVRCIRQGRQPDLTPADGRRAMELALRVAAAASAPATSPNLE